MANDHDDVTSAAQAMRNQAARLVAIGSQLVSEAERLEALSLSPVEREPSAEANRNPMCRSVVVPVAEENPGSNGCVVCGEPIVFTGKGQQFCMDDRDNSIWHYDCNERHNMRAVVRRGAKLIVCHDDITSTKWWPQLPPTTEVGCRVIARLEDGFHASLTKLRRDQSSPWVAPPMTSRRGGHWPALALSWAGLRSVEIDTNA